MIQKVEARKKRAQPNRNMTFAQIPIKVRSVANSPKNLQKMLSKMTKNKLPSIGESSLNLI